MSGSVNTNTDATASASATMTPVWRGSGSDRICAGLLASCSASSPGAMSSRPDCRRDAMRAPAAATANVPPRDWEKRTVDVAVPMSAKATAFWAAMLRIGNTMPIPSPTKNMATPTAYAGVPASSWVSAAITAAAVTEPSTRYGL
jgi:hypothetical protein